MNDDSPVIDERQPTLPEYKPGDVDDAVTVSISTTPGEWLVNTVDSVVVPMSMAEVVEALRSGKLSEGSLVWRAGMQEWAPVDIVPQLKLAARLSGIAPPPAASLTPRPTSSTKPPPKPARASSPSNALPAQAIPSRRATLPFGLPAPAAHHARPANPRPSSPRAALPPAPSHEESEVLAVYDRPVATISFDLSPPPSTRAEAVAVPQTLAPTTTDSAERRPPPPSNRDLSVVAASQFRSAQSSSKRLVWLSSLASAAAASLLTFWLSRAKPAVDAASSPAAPTEVQAQPGSLGSAVAAPPVVVPPAPSAVIEAEAPSAAPSAKPKVKHKARPRAPRPPRVVVAPAPAATEPSAEPSAEPNPYDVKLDEEPPAKAPGSHGSGLEGASGPESEAGSSSPGF